MRTIRQSICLPPRCDLRSPRLPANARRRPTISKWRVGLFYEGRWLDVARTSKKKKRPKWRVNCLRTNRLFRPNRHVILADLRVVVLWPNNAVSKERLCPWIGCGFGFFQFHCAGRSTATPDGPSYISATRHIEHNRTTSESNGNCRAKRDLQRGGCRRRAIELPMVVQRGECRFRRHLVHPSELSAC